MRTEIRKMYPNFSLQFIRLIVGLHITDTRYTLKPFSATVSIVFISRSLGKVQQIRALIVCGADTGDKHQKQMHSPTSLTAILLAVSITPSSTMASANHSVLLGSPASSIGHVIKMKSEF